MAMYSALQTALWFLARNEEEMKERDTDQITNLKLQKLLYYAQGAHLALKGEPLFDEPIEAGEHGPIVPSTYREFKAFGNHGIDFQVVNEYMALKNDPLNDIGPRETMLLEEVFQAFGQYSAWKLRELALQETPWQNTSRGAVISREAIQAYFHAYHLTDHAAQKW